MGGRCSCAVESTMLSAVGVAVPETRIGFWDGAGSCQHVFPWTVPVFAGSRASARVSVSPWSPASAASRLVESTGWCDTPVTPTPSCSTSARELGGGSGLPHLHPGPAMDLSDKPGTNSSQIAHSF